MRNYSSITPEFILSVDCLAASTTLNVTNADITPAVPFTLVLNPDTVKEEIVTVTAIDGLQFTISRGEEGTNPPKDHFDGEKARHMITGRDLQEAQDHIAATADVHGIVGSFSNLASKTYADASSSTAATSAVGTHNANTTAIHGISDTSKLAVFASASAGRKLSVQATAPTSPAVGDIWFQVTGL